MRTTTIYAEIIETLGGEFYCKDCYDDLRSPSEHDFAMFVKRRLNDGVCGCCDAEVVAGILVDNRGDSVVGFLGEDRRTGDGDEFARRYPYADERNPDR